MSDDGDSFISSSELRIWSLIQHVLLTWGTLVVFRNDRYSVVPQKDGLVTFFVPRDATFRDEIVAYIEREAKQFESQEFPARPEEGFPRIPPTRTHVQAVTYSGLLPYMDSAESEKFAREFASVAMQRLKGDLLRDRREGLKKAGPDPWWGVFGVAETEPSAIFKEEHQAKEWVADLGGRWFVKPVENPRKEVAS